MPLPPPTQECHADSIVSEYKLLYPEAYDRKDANGAVPSSAVLSRLAQLRLEPDSSEGSAPDEGAQKEGSGWDQAVRYGRSATVNRSRPLGAGLSTTGGIRKIPSGAKLQNVT